MKLDDVYLGAKVAVSLANTPLNKNDLESFKLKCLNFLIECSHQIYKRFPFGKDYIQALKMLEFLDPKNISTTNSTAVVASKFPKFFSDINSLDREFRLLKNSTLTFNDDIYSFWKKIFSQKNYDNSESFPNLCLFVKNILSLPHSSATVERIFSAINLNKTKTRNRLNNKTIRGILHFKNVLKIQGQNSVNFDISKTMISRHKNSMYSN